MTLCLQVALSVATSVVKPTAGAVPRVQSIMFHYKTTPAQLYKLQTTLGALGITIWELSITFPCNESPGKN